MTAGTAETVEMDHPGQHLLIGLPGPELDDSTEALLREIMPGGICLFSRNIREARQTRDLVDGIRELLPFEPILCIDQEGGRVDRLRKILTPMPEPGRIRSVEDVAELALIITRSIRLLGLNMTLAPVVDVLEHPRDSLNNGLVGRSFGSTKVETTQLAGRFLRTLNENGSQGCLKHFPGLGASRVDSHEELPVVDIRNDEFNDVDLYPYRKLMSSGEVHAVMIAHAAFPNLGLQEIDQNGRLLPSSLSRNMVNGLLRSEMGFTGLILSDDLEMGAILKNYGINEASVMSLNAGVDMVAICADPDNIRRAYDAVAYDLESGMLDNAGSALRIAEFRSRLASPLDFDTVEIDSLSSRIDSLCARLD